VAYPTNKEDKANLEVHLLETSALGGNLVKSSLNISITLLADTTEEELSLAEVRMLVATGIKEGTRKSVDTPVALDRVEASLWRILIAGLIVAALKLTPLRAVLADAVLVAVARAVTGLARRSAQVRSVGLGSIDDGRGHIVDSLLDGDLLLELIEVLVSGILEEDTLGSLERNFKDGNSVSDLDRSVSMSNVLGLVEGGDIHGGHVLITILAGLTVALDVGLDVIKLILEGVASLGVDLSIVDPEVRVDISDVGTDGIIPVVSKAACTDGSGSGDINVLGKSDLVEDRAREASLDVEDEVLVELLGGHLVEDGLHLRTVDIATTREADSSLRAVIIEEDKDVILRGRLEGLAAADASHVLTSKDLDEVLAGDKAASVILRNSGVHIRAVGLVDDLTRFGVLRVAGDIILHHDDDVIVRDTHLVDGLIGVAQVGLVTVVVVTVRTGGKNNPGVLLTLLLRETSKRVCTSNCNKSKKS